MKKTLFERIGGENSVRTTVMKMYDKILDDAELAPFFENVNVDKLRISQTEFVTYAFGGIKNYSGKKLRDAHKNAVTDGLSDHHFNLVVKYLKEAMQELGVEDELIAEALGIVESTRDDVLNR